MNRSWLSTPDLLAQADAFLRAGDPTAAVARARLASHVAPDLDTREECLLALSRFENAERAWRAEIAARQEAARRREEAEASVAKERIVEAAPRERRPPVRRLHIFRRPLRTPHVAGAS